MWTLGFDTTAATVTAALMKDDCLVAHYSASSSTTHSTTLLPAIENILASAGITAKDLSLISCSAGPGSFTGVRIGTATAKGLAAPFGTSCIGVSSLEAMAAVFGEIECFILPALNARRGNVYSALFASDGKGIVTRLTEDDLLSVSELRSFIEGNIPQGEARVLYVVGDSTCEILDALWSLDCTIAKRAPELLAYPSGYGAAIAGRKLFLAEDFDSEKFKASELVPIYLRKSQAERELEEKKAGLR